MTTTTAQHRPNAFGAIETRYKNCRFRSRLEARWAVFFDALSIEWQYEKEGYEKSYNLENGNEYVVRYLPDFYLPKFSCFVEVKGSHWPDNERRELAVMLDWDSPLPGFSLSETSWNSFKSFKPGLIILGDVPAVHWGRVFHPIIRHHKGLCRDLVRFDTDHSGHGDFSIENGNGWIYSLIEIESSRLGGEYFCDGSSTFEEMDPRPIVVETLKANERVMNAYKQARAARFEFGEQG